jgi:small subunit ribosomal protein S19
MQEFRFRGKTLEELKNMTFDELANILNSRGRRKLRRGLPKPHKILLMKLSKKNSVKTHCRDMIILPEMVGKKVLVHMGKAFLEVNITPDMIGHYLGEFALTRKPVKHSAPGVGATRSSKYIPLK